MKLQDLLKDLGLPIEITIDLFHDCLRQVLDSRPDIKEKVALIKQAKEASKAETYKLG
jgi:hypothetical protein